MAKIAVLLLSHRMPEALPLHAAYWGQHADLFVHVDAKVAEHRLADVGGLRMGERRRIFWGGWSMVQATIDLIRLALAADQYERFVLLSDDCAPLLPIGRMIERLAEAREFIWAGGNVAAWVQDRYDGFYCYDHPATALAVPDEEMRVLDDAFFATMRDLERLRSRGKRPVSLRHGDQWWALSRAAIQQAMVAYDKEWLRESFRFSAVPDEQYFHTTIMHGAVEKFVYTERRQPEMPPTFRSLDAIRDQVPPGFQFTRKVDCDVPEIADLIRTGQISDF